MVITKLFLILALMSYHSWTWMARSAADGEVARIRKAGEPVTYADIAATYRLPEGAIDASKEWLAVVEYFGKEDFEITNHLSLPLFDVDKRIPALAEAWPEQDEVSRFLVKHRDGVRLIAEATAKKGEARFPIAFEKGYKANLPHLNYLRNASRLTELRFHLALREQKFEQAIDAIRQGLAIAQALDKEPLVVGQLIHIAVQEQQCRLISQALAATTIEDRELESWRAQLGEFDQQAILRRAFEVERVTGIQAFGNPGQFTDDVRFEARYWVLGPGHPVQLHCYLHACRASNDAIKSNFGKAADLLWNIENWRYDADVSSYEFYRRGYLRKATFSFGTFAAWLGRAAAKTRGTAALIACEEFHRKHKRWPKSLDELSPEILPKVPSDPFSGKPLVLLVEEKRIVIYGLGFNKEDEFGRPDWLEKDDVAILEFAK